MPSQSASVVVTLHDCPGLGVVISWSFLSAASTILITQPQSQLVVAHLFSQRIHYLASGVSTTFGFMFDVAIVVVIGALFLGSLGFGATIISNAPTVMQEILGAIVLTGGLVLSALAVLMLQLNALIRAVNER